MLFNRLPGRITSRLGSVARRNVGTSAGNAIVLDSSARLPAVDGSQLTNVLMRSYLAGLTLSNDSGTPNTILDIAAGVAMNSTNVAMMSLASAYTKTTGSWAVGTGNGGLDTGTVANSTWYHVWLIQRSDTGVVDVLFSTSASAPTMPSSYDRKRRIGSFKTDASAHIVPFSQNGDEFLWKTMLTDYNATSVGTSRVSLTLTVPTGIQVWAIYKGIATLSSAACHLIFSSLDQNDPGAPATSGPAGDIISEAATNYGSGGTVHTRTNTSGQIGATAKDASTTLTLTTMGWIDRRGKDA